MHLPKLAIPLALSCSLAAPASVAEGALGSDASDLVDDLTAVTAPQDQTADADSSEKKKKDKPLPLEPGRTVSFTTDEDGACPSR